ncbi:GHMP family kinase ATP-binding protein [Mesoterricola silvestris]|uniref:Dehydrogenase n=1 Tax=Mesoterricola silvestris TaxID=2927979 RepID=A0AA48H365_9BACT|nr:hypothetical protein [Mesoterricola silvestris]BDU71073.1 dehydrogenase [Mesoterricola silvestris]
MLVHSRAPLRIGLAGGGTDVSPYSDLYGGSILNATINLFATASIRPLDGNRIVLKSLDHGLVEEHESRDFLAPEGPLQLLKGVYNRVVSQYVKRPLAFELSTHVDAPPGSGLGSSSTLVTALVGAFAEWLSLPLGEYEIARLAYEIEREDLGMAGGKQDQYAATFGGFNFMEFYGNDKVIVNPLRLKDSRILQLENNLLLFYTGASRLSSTIIEKQSRNALDKKATAIEAMHKLKTQAVEMKEALLLGRLADLGRILDFGWQSKKKMADGITNPAIDKIYETAIQAGATGGKLSGAGGGGHMIFYCPDNAWHAVSRALSPELGTVCRFQFTNTGLITWEEA